MKGAIQHTHLTKVYAIFAIIQHPSSLAHDSLAKRVQSIVTALEANVSAAPMAFRRTYMAIAKNAGMVVTFAQLACPVETVRMVAMIASIQTAVLPAAPSSLRKMESVLNVLLGAFIVSHSINASFAAIRLNSPRQEDANNADLDII